jgi:hypothetical protein
MLPLGEKEGNIIAWRPSMCSTASPANWRLSSLRPKRIEWVIVPRGQLLRCIKAVYGVGAETFEDISPTPRRTKTPLDREQSQDITTDDPEPRS